MDKVSYVMSRPHETGHHCHWPNCKTEVKPAMWGCKTHWFMLPKSIRDEIWRCFEPGQEVSKTPSDEYLEIAFRAKEWIRENYPSTV